MNQGSLAPKCSALLHPCHAATLPAERGRVDSPSSNFSELAMHPLHAPAHEIHPSPSPVSAHSCLWESIPCLCSPSDPGSLRFRGVLATPTRQVLTPVSSNWVWAQTTETWAYVDGNKWAGICPVRRNLDTGEDKQRGHRDLCPPVSVRPFSGRLPNSCGRQLGTPNSPEEKH